IFTPPVVSTYPGPLGTLILPSVTGGANWQGGAFDPETKLLYVYSVTNINAIGVAPPEGGRSDMEYVRGTARAPGSPETAAAGRAGGAGQAAAAGGGRGGAAAAGEGGGPLSVRGLPLVKPPYGRITAIDLNKGEIAWQIAHGDTPDNIKNHPALKGVTIPKTG